MIKLFEHADQPDIIVNLTEVAINIAAKTNHPDVVSTQILFIFFSHLSFISLIFSLLCTAADLIFNPVFEPSETGTL